jgi:TonB-linked SusC/RagA family outer membrane protein
MKQKLLSIFFVCVFLATATYAQNTRITGKVTDKQDGSTLPGVSIKVTGTQIGTQTDNNGNYVIEVPISAKSLEFSFIGFQTQIVSISGKTTLNVILNQDSKALQEVVFVAYGSAKKEAITGSVATLSAASIENRVVTNISNVLAGVAPGIQVNAGNGQPGSGSAVRIRGFGSISASNSPLYVLDGAVYDGNLSDINSNDIESVSLLKDASSSALYGARGANGVIMITTKRGKLGEPQVSFNFNQGLSERGVPEYDRVNAQEYYPLMWQSLRNSLVYPRTGTPLSASAAGIQASNTIHSQLFYNPFNVPNNQIVGNDGKLNPNASLLYDDFDWYAPIQRTGIRNNMDLSIGGNTGKSDYYISLGYLDDKGYIQKSDFNRFNARINVNSKVKEWFKVGLNLAGTFSRSNLASDAATGSASSFINIFNFARGMGPIYPVRAYDASGNPVLDDTGNHYWDFGQHPGSINRPNGASAGRHVIYETLLNDVMNRRVALNSRTYAEIKFLKDFTFKPSINVDFRNSFNNTFRNPIVGDGAGLGGSSNQGSNLTKTYTFNQMLTYNKSIGSHSFNVIAAHENYDLDYRATSASKIGQILVGNTEFANFVTPQSTSGSRDTYRIESYLSKLSYNYSEKYFFDASVRRDGSSRFSNASRYGNFFSLGGSWSLNKEKFLSKYKWIDDLRLKASFGQVGNDALDSYYNYQAFYNLGWNNGSEPGILLASAATPDLKWETLNTLNTGVSFSLFNNRLTGEVEWFNRGSSDLLFSVPQPLSNPITSIRKNIGNMVNRGLEIQLGGDIIRKKNFTWNFLTNWSVVRNEITKMPAETPAITSGTKRLEVGRDIFAFYLRQYVGVDATDGSALFIPNAGVTTDLRTVNGNTYTTNFNNAKFDYSGSSIPDFFGAVTNTFNYKSFSFSFLINYQVGGKFYDGNYAGLMSVRYGSSLHKDALNSWTETNTNSNIPRLDVGSTSFLNAQSTRWLVDASYVSFTNASFSYRLPQNLVRKIDLKNVRLFTAGENLGIISKRKGLNPAESFNGTNSNTYLPSRTITFGLGVNF